MSEPKDYWIKKAEELKKLKHFEQAVECMTKASELEEHEKKSDHWYHRGASLNEIGKYAEAVNCFEKELEVNPPKFDTFLQKGISLYYLKQSLEALECLKKAWELNYANYLKTKEQLDSLKLHKKFEIALDYATDLQTGTSLPEKFWQYKGLILTDLKKFDEAIKCYDEALTIKKNDPSILDDKTNCEILREKEVKN